MTQVYGTCEHYFTSSFFGLFSNNLIIKQHQFGDRLIHIDLIINKFILNIKFINIQWEATSNNFLISFPIMTWNQVKVGHFILPLLTTLS
jgi:hypothetical protein